jgi:DNA-binding CsgD family transcriptional regulator
LSRDRALGARLLDRSLRRGIIGLENPVVGRDGEFAFLREKLERRSPTASLLVGDPGIGKTTVWQSALDQAAHDGWVVLTARGSGAETQLSFAALGDLLEPLGGEPVSALPAPQHRAVAAALLLEDVEDSTVDLRAVGLGLLNVLRAVTRSDACVIGVDDLQWVDAASAAALEFALRRLRDEPVLVVATARSDSELPLELDRLLPTHRLEIGPLSLGALRHVLSTELGFSPPRRALRRIHEVSGGNPFYALELARNRRSDGELDEAVLPASLEALVRNRLDVLPEPTREALFDVAALAEPTPALADAAALEPAIQARVIALEGDRLSFTHPLLAAAAYATLPPPRRAEAHARLAELASTREERARHLALATQAPDEAVATELSAAATEAMRRGAAAAAAELLDHAIRITPDRAPLVAAQRMLAAADAKLAAGEWEEARSLLREVRAGGEPRLAAETAARLATWVLEDVVQGVALCEAALADVSDDPALRSRLLSALCANLHLLGEHRRAMARAQEAVADAELAADERGLAVALGWLGMFEVLTAEGDAVAHLERARQLAGGDERLLPVRPGTWLGLRHLFRHELVEARRYLEAEHAAALEAEDDAQRSAILLHLCELEWRSGDWAAALRHAEEGHDLAEQVGDAQGQGALLYARALITGHLGRIEESRAATDEGLRLAAGIEDRLFPAMHAVAAGARELSLGAYDDALAHFARLDEIFGEQALDPGIALYQGDAIEALVAVGRVAEAAERVERLECRARELGRSYALAEAQRSRGLVLATQGDLDGAAAALERSLAELAPIEAPFTRARTLLVLGQLQRRRKQRRAARETLTDAIAIFEQIGALLWAAKARAEMGRIGGRKPAGTGLTETEQRVAELVAEGKSNKQVAAELYITINTVETHLSRIYRKLGVRSRGELAQRLRS